VNTRAFIYKYAIPSFKFVFPCVSFLFTPTATPRLIAVVVYTRHPPPTLLNLLASFIIPFSRLMSVLSMYPIHLICLDMYVKYDMTIYMTYVGYIPGFALSIVVFQMNEDRFCVYAS